MADLCSFGKSIIAIGDHGQLEPVNDRGTSLMRSPMFRLEALHRNAGPIARFAHFLRDGNPASEWEEDTDAVNVLDYHRVHDDLLLDVTNAGGIIICGKNKTRVKTNRLIRDLLGREPGELLALDRVICLANNRRLGLFNGMLGTSGNVHENIEFEFLADDGSKQYVFFDPDALEAERHEHDHRSGMMPFAFAYCVTCHKAQGSEWDQVLVMEEHGGRLWDQRRWNYTAASRARKRLVWQLRPGQVAKVSSGKAVANAR